MESLEQFTRTLMEMAAKGVAATDESMLRTVSKLEAEMKRRAGEGGSHPYGTPTPAVQGSGPAVISGDLRRSITHQKDGNAYRIGPASIPHTQYASRRRGRGTGGTATSGEIGAWLENGGRYGVAYPFVGPALDAVSGEIEQTVKDTFDEESW